MSRLPPPPIENKLQILVSLYKKKSGRCRSLFLVALLVTLSIMGYIVIYSYDLVNLNIMENTSAGGGSNMVTATYKKDIIRAPHSNNSQNTPTFMNLKSDTSFSIRAPHEVDDWANDLVCSTPIEPIISNIPPLTDDLIGGNNPKYINVGMPKSGSTSLTYLFNRAGIKTSHYKNCRKKNGNINFKKTKKQRTYKKEQVKCGSCIKDVIDNNALHNIFLECGNFTMWGEMNFNRNKNVNVCIYPQIQYLEKIYTDAPHATWIMPMRNVSDWIDSVTRWGRIPGTFRDDFGPCNFPQIGFKGSTDLMDDRKMMAMYCNHIVQIREFVKSHQSLSLIEFRIEDPNVGNFLENLLPIDADDWGKQNVNNKSKQVDMKAIAATQNINAARASNNSISHVTSEDPVPVHRDNDNVREHSSFTSAAEFDDACIRLPRLQVNIKSRFNHNFNSNTGPGWPNNHFHSAFQLHAIIYWAMVSQNLEEVCLYLPENHPRQYREYLNVLLPTFRFVLHPSLELFNDSLTAAEMQPMSSFRQWKKWIRNHPNGEPYRKFLQYLQTQNHKYECSDSDPEVVFLKRMSPDPQDRIVKGDPIHAIPKVEEIALSMNATFGVFTGGEHDLITQARKFKCARVVIGQHGADMTNMMFAIHGRLQCIIEGPKILQQCFKVMASEMKADYHKVGAVESKSQPGKEWDLDQLSKSTRACIRDYKSSESE
jgi:hypothetical protein